MFFTNILRPKIVGISLIFLLAMIPPLVEYGGWDFLYAYRQDAVNQTLGRRTWNPYPTYWFILLFAFFPPQLSYLLWNIAGACAFVFAIRYWAAEEKNNGEASATYSYLKFGLSLPCFWIFFGGQIEGFLALGIVLSLMPNPWLAGMGVTLLTMKPQLGFFPLIFVLFHRVYRQKKGWHILIVPALIYLASFFYWGWWIPEWLRSLQGRGILRQAATNISLYPYSLILLPVLWWGRQSLKIWLIIQSLVLPYFAVYSLAVLFTLEIPAWAMLFLWGLYLSAGTIDYVIIPGFLVPILMLVFMAISRRQDFSWSAPWLK